MRLNVANNFETFLTSGITDTDTEITVDDSTGAPDAPFRLRIDELELIQVNSVSGNTFTVERGVEGTLAVAHSIGAKVELTWTAGVKESMDVELDAHKAENANKAHGGFKGILVEKTEHQETSAGSSTQITWQSIVYQYGNFFNPSSPTRLTIPEGVSKVKLSGNLRVTSRETLELRITKNGGHFPGYAYHFLDGAERLNLSTPVYEVNEGDYFELVVITSTSNTARFDSSTWFALEVIE